MTVKSINAEESKAKSTLRIFQGYIRVTAIIFAAVGLLLFSIVLADLAPLRKPDLLFGLSNRTVMVFAGILHLTLGGFLLWAGDPVGRGILALSAGFSYMIYSLGMGWLKPGPPYPVQFIAWKLGFSAQAVSNCWRMFIAYLILGGLLILIVEWRRLKQSGIEMLLSRWIEMRDRNICEHKPGKHDNILVRGSIAKTDSSSLPVRKGRVSSKQLMTEFKFSCPSCGQHIRCGVGYSGSRISCPTCKNEIVVPKRNTSQS